MLNIPERAVSAFTHDSLSDINKVYSQYSVSTGNINDINRVMTQMGGTVLGTAAQAAFFAGAMNAMNSAQPAAAYPQNNYPQNNYSNAAPAYPQAYQSPYNSQGAVPQQSQPSYNAAPVNNNGVYPAPASFPSPSSYPPPASYRQTPPPAPAVNNPPPQTPAPAAKPLPNFTNPTRKGMKTQLPPCRTIKACLGWKINDRRCDVDASAFLLDETEKIIAEDWFVFYGQPQSPDRSVIYRTEDPIYQKYFDIDLEKLNTNVKKIVFVVTIDEAISKNLNFGMLRDVYIRLMSPDGNEILSFMLGDYYENVTSMMVGELYIHKGQWKFNAIGNGVARDLAGLCNFYGIEII